MIEEIIIKDVVRFFTKDYTIIMQYVSENKEFVEVYAEITYCKGGVFMRSTIKQHIRKETYNRVFHKFIHQRFPGHISTYVACIDPTALNSDEYIGIEGINRTKGLEIPISLRNLEILIMSEEETINTVVIDM